MLTQTVRRLVPTYGYTIPAREAMTAELERTKFTPDVAMLSEFEWQAIFVTDELKKKFLKHHLLGEDKKYCFPAFTQKNYHYWESTSPLEGAIPFESSQLCNPVVGWPPIAKIKGEVYLIRPNMFWEGLDAYKENTVQYVRDRIRLIVPYRVVKWVRDPSIHHFFNDPVQYFNRSTMLTEELTCIIRAWMYSGKPEYWDPIITAYDYGHVETFHSKNRRWCETYYTIRRPALTPLPPPLP